MQLSDRMKTTLFLVLPLLQSAETSNGSDEQALGKGRRGQPRPGEGDCPGSPVGTPRRTRAVGASGQPRAALSVAIREQETSERGRTKKGLLDPCLAAGELGQAWAAPRANCLFS